jgi:hypothetical protein
MDCDAGTARVCCRVFFCCVCYSFNVFCCFRYLRFSCTSFESLHDGCARRNGSFFSVAWDTGIYCGTPSVCILETHEKPGQNCTRVDRAVSAVSGPVATHKSKYVHFRGEQTNGKCGDDVLLRSFPLSFVMVCAPQLSESDLTANKPALWSPGFLVY